VCVTRLHWLDCSKSICGEARSILPCVECDCCDCCDCLADIAARLDCFAEFVLVSLHSGVLAGNRIGDEGVKALGDALKDNTTLSSLSLNLHGEWLLFRVFRFLRQYCGKAHGFSLSQFLKGTKQTSRCVLSCFTL
jgi:hypothetical protein